MEITWYGLSCFRLTERNLATVVTDPYDNQTAGYEPLKLRADILTVSHEGSRAQLHLGCEGLFTPDYHTRRV